MFCSLDFSNSLNSALSRIDRSTKPDFCPFEKFDLMKSETGGDSENDAVIFSPSGGGFLPEFLRFPP
jgi:hypothetical protein